MVSLSRMPARCEAFPRPLVRRLAPRMAVVLLAFVAGPFAAAPAVPLTAQNDVLLAAHTAVYDMRLASARSSAGIVGASGTMRYSFADSCDGWTVETHTDLTMVQTQGGPVQNTWDFLAWEAKDSASYRFKVRSSRDGELVDTFEGEARLSPGGAGTAVFHRTDGADAVFDLPKGTLFPTAHTLEIIRRARQGSRFFSASVFDGSTVRGPFDVSVAVAAGQSPGTRTAGEKGTGLSSPLLDNMAWPIVLAFYAPEDNDDTPDFEVRARYHDNGIADELLQDFGDFTLRGVLQSLEGKPKPRC